MNEVDEDDNSNDDEDDVIEFEVKNEKETEWEVKDTMIANSTLTCVASSVASTVLSCWTRRSCGLLTRVP